MSQTITNTPGALPASIAAALAPATVRPDAGLVIACQQHLRNIDACNADPEDAGPGNPISAEYERALDIISAAKPVTLEGLAAKARAALAEAESEAPPEGPGQELIWDVVNDLVRIAGGAA
jgi:hypothetical protein